MNLTKEQTTEVLSNFLSKENGLNEVLRMMLNAMMHCERGTFLESSQGNKGNGYRLGKVFGHGTELELRIPRDRLSHFTPTLLALFRDQEQYLKEVSFALYSKGLTTRDISDVLQTIYGGHYSKSTISNFSQSFYDRMQQWRERSLESHYLALYIDGTFTKVRLSNSYKSECFYIILGLKEDYTREVISIVNIPEESSQGWSLVFEGLKERGLSSVGVFVSDSLPRLEKVIHKQFMSSSHQKCVVHLQRNLRSYVRKDDKAKLAEELREVLSPDKQDYGQEQALAAFEVFKARWGASYPALGKYLNKLDILPYLTYLRYDYRVRRMVYTTNWIERFNKSVKRTLKIRGSMPSEASVLALITSVAMNKGEKIYRYPIYNFKFEPKLTARYSSLFPPAGGNKEGCPLDGTETF